MQDTKAAGEHEEDAAVEEGGEGGDEETDSTSLLPPAMQILPFEEVTIPMKDGLELSGKLYDPSMYRDSDGETVIPANEVEEYTGERYPLVILLHGLNHTQSNWSTMPAILVKAGYAVFTMDVRGHGKSTKTRQGRKINWRMLDTRQWSRVHRDVIQVINFFEKGEEYPEVDGHQAALIGEQLGANLAAQTARQELRVKALVMLSPEQPLKGLDAGKDLVDYPNRTMILVSEDDKDRYTTAKQLFTWVAGPKIMQVYQKLGVGADMIANRETVGHHIRDWLIKAYPPSGKPPLDEKSEAVTEKITDPKAGAKPDAKSEAKPPNSSG